MGRRGEARQAMRRARKRFIYRGAAILAVAIMLAIADAQLAIYGVAGLTDGGFIGLDLGLGIVMFVMGTWPAAAVEALTRTRRERRKGEPRVEDLE